MRSDRPSWDSYFLTIANAVSLRADCTRTQHGAVIVRHNRVVATGYNGGPAGGPSCLDGQCPRGLKSYDELPPLSPDYSDCISIHAEQNAIMYARFEELKGATIYITGAPCSTCRKLIAGAGIVRTVHL